MFAFRLPYGRAFAAGGRQKKMTARKTDGQMRSLTARSPQETEFQRLCYSARPNDVALGFGFFYPPARSYDSTKGDVCQQGSGRGAMKKIYRSYRKKNAPQAFLQGCLSRARVALKGAVCERARPIPQKGYAVLSFYANAEICQSVLHDFLLRESRDSFFGSAGRPLQAGAPRRKNKNKIKKELQLRPSD